MARQRHAWIWRSLPVALIASNAPMPKIALGATVSGTIATTSETCHGFDEMYTTCPGPDGPCDKSCTPVNCKFADWEDWMSEGGCTGLLFRHRSIEIENNECGRPCDGEKSQSKVSIVSECARPPVNCTFSLWSEWSECGSDLDQQYRTRSVSRPASHYGAPCVGDTKDTRPCASAAKVVDCVLGPWSDYTRCSATCGTGYQTRTRRVTQHSMNSGLPCQGVTYEMNACLNLPPCPDQDCKFGDWGEWSVCDPSTRPQSSRMRVIIQKNLGLGEPCRGDTKETKGCDEPDQKNCELSDWQEWHMCDKTCDGGQKMRRRILLSPPMNGGDCPTADLIETGPCNEGPCHTGDMDCKLSDWETWGGCSSACGSGTTKRKRTIKSPAVEDGFGCIGPLEEVKPCRGSACGKLDCKWGEWDDWSSCSCTCGGGSMRRNRVVIQFPNYGGKMCKGETKSEIEACATQPCPAGCIDGKWGQWSEWSTCSATCVGGFKSRRREAEQQPNHCGAQLVGAKEEFTLCSGLPSCEPDADCTVSDWNDWSECSCSCFGVRERNRVVKNFARGQGHRCAHELKHTEPCNPGLGENASRLCGAIRHDCKMSSWSEWTECTRTCGKGQKQRNRHIALPAFNGGKPCDGDFSETEDCNTQSCINQTCTDCLWSQWDHWSDCTRCGGQRYRQRFIMQMPNECGNKCDLSAAKEVAGCVMECETPHLCHWTDWSDTSCANQCTAGTSGLRTRQLKLEEKKNTTAFGANMILFEGSETSECVGSQLSLARCEAPPGCDVCRPKDCEFAPWGPWSAPTCTGLCERSRTIASANNECGDPCRGPLIDTKYCHPDCDNEQDCELGEWSEWSACEGPLAQKKRYRSIVKEPTTRGSPCEGLLSETVGCGRLHRKDCKLTDWSPWQSMSGGATCSEPCGPGLHVRFRNVSQEAEGGGRPCESEPLTQLEKCEIAACPRKSKACILGDWDTWSACGANYQIHRSRKIVQDAVEGGEPCQGPLQQTASCAGDDVVDCIMSEWTAWDTCDKTCGGGQQYRHRSVKVFPAMGGKPCPSVLHETAGCNKDPCSSQNCEVGSWGDWGDCSAKCGIGQQLRHREVASIRNVGGLGCYNSLEQTKECMETTCGIVDCQWGDWHDWSGCSCTCGGGMQTRSRLISVAPRGGGLSCKPHDKEEIRPCNTKKCGTEQCTDGAWKPWADWSVCSRSCGGGTQFRTRNIARMATSCGSPATGDDRQVRFCSVGVACSASVDCEFGEWGSWSDCSMPCDGIKRRSRRISRYGRGDGKYCMGALKETYPCNPGPNETVPAECKAADPIDAEWSAWSSWTECTATCGGGQHTRSRSVATPPLQGGKPLTGAIEQMEECGRNTCPTDGHPMKQDCEFGDWEDWGACSKCGGQMKRFRSIAKYPRDGGANCHEGAHQETKACSRHCSTESFCVWSDWETWGACNAKCGTGKKVRKRYLHSSATMPGHPANQKALIEKYLDLEQQFHQRAEHTSVPELTMAFTTGCGVFLVASAVLRLLPLRRHRESALEFAYDIEVQ